MKKTILITALLLVVCSCYSNNPGWRFGMKGAPSLSWIRPETRHYVDEGTIFGFSYGIIGDKFFSDNYAISSGLFITQQGGKVSFPQGNNIDKRVYELQYIDIPLSLKMLTREFGYFSFFGQFGVSTGINIRAKVDEHIGTTIDDDINISDDINLAKFSLIMGGGLEYSLLGNTAIIFGFYYNNGFSNIIKDDDFSALANFIEITVGIIF